MTKQQPNAGGQAPLNVSIALAGASTQHQNEMECQPESRDGSETSDVANMDDVQFSASLDRLLDNELADSSFEAIRAVNIVSADPSVSSSASSRTGWRGPQQLATSFSVPPAASMPKQQSAQESTSLFPPPAKKPALGAGPSALTARLAYYSQSSLASDTPMRFIAPAATTSAPPKRIRDMTAVSEDEGDRERRRHERNLREQERSRRITEQIKYLREVLSDANVPCKPDKNSTLISVADYIRQLQDRSSLLDNEHKKLLDTIARTNEMVNKQYYQATVGGTSVSSYVSNDSTTDAKIARNLLEDENAVFVKGLDYKSVFKRCGVALAVASVDGRFMDCNEEFEKLSGYSRNELLPATELSVTEVRPDVAPSASTTFSSEHPPRNLSLFNLLTHEDMEQVFSAMSGMLRSPVGSRPNAPPVTGAAPHQDYWCGVVHQNREHNSTRLRMNITLVRTPGGRPKFFNCSLTGEQR